MPRSKKPELDVHIKSVDLAKEAERKRRRRLMRLPATYDGPVQPGQRWSYQGVVYEVKLVTDQGTVTLEARHHFWLTCVDELVRVATQLTDPDEGVNLDTSNPTSTPPSKSDSTEPPEPNSGSVES